MTEEEKFPGRIRKLPEIVVNKIAAGEILQRPSSAVKELIENSIDAKSTLINVTLKDAGFKLLQIQDNGNGIHKADLKIVCERFTTSKLSEYKDLQSISSHGFRGEALASICLVSSQLTITTRTCSSELAYKAVYKEGTFCQDSVRPLAGNQGTLISIENLFFNMPLRRESLPNHNEELSRILSLITKYALHYYQIGFSLHKQGDNAVNDFRTVSMASQKEKLAELFSTCLMKDALDVEMSDVAELHFKCTGFISRPSYVSKKYTFILFVNNRLVDCPSLKKSIQNVYSVYLLKGNNPFVYLNLSVKGDEIDVNVHPSKEEIRLLYEIEIVEKISKKCDQLLINSNSNQQFMVKTVNPFSNRDTLAFTPPQCKEKFIGAKRNSDSFNNSPLLNSTQSSFVSESPAHTVRVDPKLQSLDTFLTKAPKNENSSASNLDNVSCAKEKPNEVTDPRETPNYPPRRTFKLTSLLTLRQKVEQDTCSKLREIISNCSYVGSSSPDIAFIQHSTELYLLNMQDLSRQLFYQILIYDFGNFGRFSFSSQSMNVEQLAKLALTKSKKFREVYNCSQSKLNSTLKEINEKFASRSSMLADYFSWEISDENRVVSFPMLLRNYEPSFEILPELMVELALKGCWDSEQECFHTFSAIISDYYAICSRFWIHRPEKDWKYIHQHVLLPAMKLFLQPSKNYQNSFAQVASLPQLYKIFERC